MNQRDHELIDVLKSIDKRLKRIADALENQQQPEEIKQPEAIIRTYRDVMKERLPHRVSEGYRGGVKGCPPDYFAGAEPPTYCQAGRPNITCSDCWCRLYKGEELILE